MKRKPAKCRDPQDIDGLKVGSKHFLRLKLGAVLVYDSTMDFLACIGMDRAREVFGPDCLDNLEQMDDA